MPAASPMACRSRTNLGAGWSRDDHVSRTRCSVLHAAPQSRDPPQHHIRHGPRISSAPRRKGGALRSIRGTFTLTKPSFSQMRAQRSGVLEPIITLRWCPYFWTIRIMHDQDPASRHSTRLPRFGRTLRICSKTQTCTAESLRILTFPGLAHRELGKRRCDTHVKRHSPSAIQLQPVPLAMLSYIARYEH
jgi:hypothetical protein